MLTDPDLIELKNRKIEKVRRPERRDDVRNYLVNLATLCQREVPLPLPRWWSQPDLLDPVLWEKHRPEVERAINTTIQNYLVLPAETAKQYQLPQYIWPHPTLALPLLTIEDHVVRKFIAPSGFCYASELISNENNAFSLFWSATQFFLTALIEIISTPIKPLPIHKAHNVFRTVFIDFLHADYLDSTIIGCFGAPNDESLDAVSDKLIFATNKAFASLKHSVDLLPPIRSVRQLHRQLHTQLNEKPLPNEINELYSAFTVNSNRTIDLALAADIAFRIIGHFNWPFDFPPNQLFELIFDHMLFFELCAYPSDILLIPDWSWIWNAINIAFIPDLNCATKDQFDSAASLLIESFPIPFYMTFDPAILQLYEIFKDWENIGDSWGSQLTDVL